MLKYRPEGERDRLASFIDDRERKVGGTRSKCLK